MSEFTLRERIMAARCAIVLHSSYKTLLPDYNMGKRDAVHLILPKHSTEMRREVSRVVRQLRAEDRARKAA